MNMQILKIIWSQIWNTSGRRFVNIDDKSSANPLVATTSSCLHWPFHALTIFHLFSNVYMLLMRALPFKRDDYVLSGNIYC